MKGCFFALVPVFMQPESCKSLLLVLEHLIYSLHVCLEDLFTLVRVFVFLNWWLGSKQFLKVLIARL